ncbi:hypothetical protein JVT61DRAFT_385 [Boletus reticuloceps]|uniref:Uncharacterized protein n=1 Tax=Boletus reticuloceps TaxID=495285 RepID=A0A8I2Z142_9AGAM|nr:hypothetical protein JVT61DRAFT_385 [Boletus reticuloceps]
MHDDDAAQRRPSTAHDRPSRTPFGPRRPKNALADMSPISDQPTTHTDAAVQAPTTPPLQKSAPATFIPPPPLTPPPTISFESTPIPWKGLPLEAAQWTFSSPELQEIVSMAIRLSARDSFVRLLSLQALEVDIVHEAERLEEARLAAQARWRFELSRRTMLMQALNAAAAFSGSEQGGSTDASASPVLGFVGQLASAVASCDSLLSTILHISDQQSQIALVQHQHWASALGMALRKLNKAHERQGQELKRVQDRVQSLEDELEEAWHEAEKMAIEFDDLEQEVAESESELASEVMEDPDANAPVPYICSDIEPKLDFDETGTLGDMTIHTDIAVVLGVTATAVASKAILVTSSPKPVGKSDTKSIPSVKSTRSRRSTRDAQSHISRLSSARMRSRATSNASLRLPKALRSIPSTHAFPVDAPPMPLPQTAQGHSFLDMDNLSREHTRKAVPPQRPYRFSLSCPYLPDSTGHPEPTLALPSPPHSAGLHPTRVPSIWLESDGGNSTHLNGLDRTHSLQIFSALAPRRARRSNLVMSLTRTGSSDGDIGSGSGSPSASSAENVSVGASMEIGTGTAPQSLTSNQSLVSFPMAVGTSETGHATASPTSNHSPISLPTHALAHFRNSSLVSTQSQSHAQRPGSAGARLTTAHEETRGPRRSLMSRASSVILRRLSQATTGSVRGVTGAPGPGAVVATGGGGKGAGSPLRSREARLNGGRLLVERWRDRGKEGERDGQGCRKGAGEDEGEGEVMLIGSPHADVFDAP